MMRRLAGEEFLANAEREARARGLGAFPIVDVDCHHYEMESWSEIAQYIDHPTIRRRALETTKRPGQFALLQPTVGDQNVAGRIHRASPPAEELDRGVHRDVAILRQAMRKIGINYAIVFPTTMLTLGLHPQIEVEVAVAHAYAKWITERVTPYDHAIGTMLYLPFNDPDASIRLVEEFGSRPGVAGFMVTSVRFQPVHDRRYMPVYAALEECGLPLSFHAMYNWQDRGMEQFNRFLSVHALGFPLYNMIHLINITVNGIPERFPRLKFIWMEAGVAWIPFLMMRLDSEYMMRPSEAPQLTKKPSEYMRQYYYTSQPLEYPDKPAHLETIFDMIGAETQLLYSSDYPHWDFDLPSRIYDLAFLSETAKRRILGGNAMELFQIPPSSVVAQVPT
jgi:predicted TIM-barrel fold metal-dependent hydrolase